MTQENESSEIAERILGLMAMLIFWTIVFEAFFRIGYAPNMHQQCINSHVAPASVMAEYCACRKKRLISERYSLVPDYVISPFQDGNFSFKYYRHAVEEELAPCESVRDNGAKDNISNTIRNDVHEAVLKRLSKQSRERLHAVRLQDYSIQIHPDKKYRYVAHVKIAVGFRVFFGVIEYDNYTSKLYYDEQAIFYDADFEQAGSHIDADGLIQGIGRVQKLFE